MKISVVNVVYFLRNEEKKNLCWITMRWRVFFMYISIKAGNRCKPSACTFFCTKKKCAHKKHLTLSWKTQVIVLSKVSMRGLRNSLLFVCMQIAEECTACYFQFFLLVLSTRAILNRFKLLFFRLIFHSNCNDNFKLINCS